MGEFVRVETAKGIATIRLDRPKMNALNRQVQEEIAECARQVDADTGVHAVVVYGGERVFAAGADIKEMAGMSYADMSVHSGALQDCFTAVAQIGKPVIAAVTGYALGGGCELALCADIRIAGESAKFGQPEILLGIIPGAGGTQRLPRLVGPARARTSSSPAATSPPRRRWRSGWSTGSSPTPTSTTRRSPTPPGSSAVPRWPCAPPSRPSTAASRWTWPPAWRSSGSSSRPCSPPTTPGSACAPSRRRLRPRSPAAELRPGGQCAAFEEIRFGGGAGVGCAAFERRSGPCSTGR